MGKRNALDGDLDADGQFQDAHAVGFLLSAALLVYIYQNHTARLA